MWWAFENSHVSSVYARAIRDIYEGAVTSVRAVEEEIHSFPYCDGLRVWHEDEFTKDTKMSSLCCMVSAVGFCLDGENKERANRKLEL